MHTKPYITAGVGWWHELHVQDGIHHQGCTWLLHLRPQRALLCWALLLVQVAMPAAAWPAWLQAPDAAHEQLHLFWSPPECRLCGHAVR